MLGAACRLRWVLLVIEMKPGVLLQAQLFLSLQSFG